MKKIFVLLALIFLVTGCTNITDDNLEKVVDNVLTSNVNLKNQFFSGYQYYLPREVSLIDKFDYNTILLYKSNKIYLYVDVISYYHKTEEKYQLNDDTYFSKLLENGNKKGYINIHEKDDLYYIEMEYNYGKIETYSKKENLTNTVINSLYILKTLKFNNVVIESLIGENKIEYKEEKFDLFKSDSNDDEYLDIIKDEDDSYIIENKENLFDEDKIELEEEDELNN